MAKEQISIRLPSEILRQIDEMAAKQTRTRNNMIEVIVIGAIKDKIKGEHDVVQEKLWNAELEPEFQSDITFFGEKEPCE